MSDATDGFAPAKITSAGKSTKSGKSITKKLLGEPGSAQQMKAIEQIRLKAIWFTQQLQPYWIRTARWHKRYYAERDEFRKTGEEWRAKISVPKAYAGVETKVAILTDILTASDPPIQAENITEDAYDAAKKTERLLSYTLLRNNWVGRTLPGLLRMNCIQGTQPYKVVWKDDRYTVEVPNSPEALADFQARLSEALSAQNIWSADQIPDFSQDMEGFMAWRDRVNTAMNGNGIKVPEPPDTTKEIIRYRGPWIDMPSLYDVWYDPLVDRVQEQALFVQRSLKTESWCLEKVKKGIWDGEAVERSFKGGGDQLPNSQDKDLNQILGINQDKNMEPGLRKPLVEVWECYQPTSELKYSVILNRVSFVNLDPTQMPFSHGQIPIELLRNVYVPGRAIGISELQINDSMYDELDTMRELRIDRTKLETLNAFSYSKSDALSELRRQMSPGVLIPTTGRGQLLNPIFQFSPTNAFADMNLAERTIDDANATYDSTRGAPAQINRVSASESGGRANLALTRHKLQALGIEDGLYTLAHQAVNLWFEKADPELRVHIAGGDVPVSPNDLVQSLEIDFRFRGATQALNRDQVAQKIIEGLKSGSALMTPVEMRTLIKQLFENLQLKQLSQLMSADGDAFFATVFQMSQQKQQMEERQLAQAMRAMMAPTPTEVPADAAAALAQPGNPPPGQPGAPPPASVGAPPLPPPQMPPTLQ